MNTGHNFEGSTPWLQGRDLTASEKQCFWGIIRYIEKRQYPTGATAVKEKKERKKSGQKKDKLRKKEK